jgi:hypothetical protein
MRAAVAVAAVLGGGLAACGDSAIDVRLRLPTGDGAGVDLSCVAAVRVYAWSNDELADPPNTCIVLDEPVATFDELRDAVRGRFELELPAAGLGGIDVAGMTTADCFGDAIFYGGAEFDGGDMTIPLRPQFDCTERTTLVVRPVDYATLATTGACTTAATRLDRGSIHPTMLDAPLPAMVYELAGVAANVSAAGTATFADAMVAFDGDACTAIGDPLTGSISCLRPGSPGVCSTAGQTELATIDFDFADLSLDPTAGQRYAQVVFAAVWDATAIPPHPIANARIAIEDAADAEIHYAQLTAGGGSLTDLPDATATTAGGLFVAYMARPIAVTITAPGYFGRSVRLTAADFIYGATTIVLSPMPQ